MRATFASKAFQGKVIGVTGAGHGIGEATVLRLAGLGAAVVALELDRSRLRRLAATLRGRKADALCLPADVGDLSALEWAVKTAVRRFGRIDGWVSNAGINSIVPLDEQPADEFARIWEVNVRAAWYAAKLLAPILSRQAAGGAIVNVGSIMSQVTLGGHAAYTSSKAAIEGLTRALAVDLAPRLIRVNAVLPGYILVTDPPAKSATGRRRKLAQLNYDKSLLTSRQIQPWPRTGRPDDIANAVVFLLSDAAGFVTGTTLTVDGGYTCEFKALTDVPRHDAAAQVIDLAREIDRLRKEPGR